MPLSAVPGSAEPELPAHLPGGVRGQQDGAGAGGRLQAGGAVGGLADDEELAGGPFGQPVTTISPVSMPTRICRRTPCAVSICTLSCSSAATMARAARTARAASSSRDR